MDLEACGAGVMDWNKSAADYVDTINAAGARAATK